MRFALSWGVLVYSRGILTQLLVVALVLVACGNKCAPGVGSGSSGEGSAVAVGAAIAPAPPTGSAMGSAVGSAASTPEGAQPVDDTSLGANIALSALGGRVIAPIEPADRDIVWKTSNLIDGFPVIRGVGEFRDSLGWKPANEVPAFPYELVFAFKAEREATLAAIVLDTASGDNVGNPAGLPKDVELFASTTSPTGDWKPIATASLPRFAGENILKLEGVHAKYVKLVIKTSYDAGVRPQLGEVGIYEAASAPSIVADVPKNLLSPPLGGSIVKFTSQEGQGEAYYLLDGVTDEHHGWSSGPNDVENPPRFPHELTFAFRDHRPATIDRVVISPKSGIIYGTPTTALWAKTIEVQTSDDSPWQGFQTVKTVTVGTDGAPITVPIGRAIRFLRLRILENQGATRTTLGEVEAFEAAVPRSLIAGRNIPLVASSPSTIVAGGETAARREREPNNDRAQADPLTSPAPVGGALEPIGDRDMFLVPGAAKTGKQTVTVGVEGRPAIRSRITVIDAGGRTRYELDPSKTSGPTSRFSVLTDAGDVILQVTQPPAAQVVIWDSSGSMEPRVKDLDAALHSYLNQLAPTDRVQLIRFDDSIEVLMKEFTGDKAALVAALKDKVYADGGTSIYDAITKGIESLDKQQGSRAIVMLTDGEDTTSKMDPSAFWTKIERAGVRVYAIGLGNGLRNFVVRSGATAERVLSDAALLTGGRYAFVADSAKLGPIYAQIGAELRAPASYAISASVATGNGQLVVKSVGDQLAVPPRVELVLDASGSMRRKAGSGSMMDAAKGVLTDVVAKLPANATVALRVYGHRRPEGKPDACQDSELVVPFGALDRKQLTSTIKRVNALGTTPIAYSILQAGEDLKNAKGPAVMMLVTDGKEECGGDPVAAISALKAAGLDITLNIVGFALTDAGDRDAMTKVAAASGGRFFDARGADGLKSAVDQAMAVPFVAVDATGEIVARGLVGGPAVAAPAGDLTVRLDTAATPVVIDHVVVAPSKVTSVELNKDGDKVGAKISAPGSTP